MKKALIAMSGGVDSSLAAKLTKDMGLDCIGCTMKLYNNEDAGISPSKTCCSLDDVEDARAVAFRLGIPYYVFDFSADFRAQVIKRFIAAYESGATPNPCIDCNRYMKFEKLLDRAKTLGCEYVVTGHYAKIEKSDGKYLLKKAADETKDQSYVLYSLTQEQLAHVLFPLGNMRKTEVRAAARQSNFLNAGKAESQDICFVPDGDYAGFIKRITGKDYPAGDFVDTAGKPLGRHAGIINYTVGQRKGLGIALGAPAYVKRIDPENNTVTLCDNAGLFTKRFIASGFNWISGEAPAGEIKCKAKVRYRQPEQPATARVTDGGRVEIIFAEPQRAISKGQAAVLYDGDTVLGGGTITETE